MPRSFYQRLTIEGSSFEDDRSVFAEDVRNGLGRNSKRLACRHIYDGTGSELFELICGLPEYYLTRAEREILERRAGEIVCELPPDTVLVELGSGSSRKTRILLDAFIQYHGRAHYVPIDISEDALQSAADELLADLQDLEITGFAGEYEAGLEFASQTFDGPLCVMWLGSSVGNFDRASATSFLAHVCSTMAAADMLLLGVDLRKDRAMLEAAYDDAAGVTARFNSNILERINREFGGEFDLERFCYEARWNEEQGRVEMYQVSTMDQEIRIVDLNVRIRFAAGEAIHTESSYKYSTEEIDDLAESAGFEVRQRWFDHRRRYTLNRLVPA